MTSCYYSLRMGEGNTSPDLARNHPDLDWSQVEYGLYQLAYSWCCDSGQAQALTRDALASNSLSGADDQHEVLVQASRVLLQRWLDNLRQQFPTVDVELLCISGADNEASCQVSSVQTGMAGNVRTAVAKLPMAQRVVVTLVDLAGLSYQEASQVTGVSEQTVQRRLVLARRNLLVWLSTLWS